MNVRTRLVCLALALSLSALTARADTASPTTRAARLNSVQGTVTVVVAPNTEPVPAQPNQPLFAGTTLLTAADGQAEVEFEDGSVVRLTPNTALSLDILTIDDAGVFSTALSLLHGLAYVELRSAPQYRYTLNAGGDLLTPVENTTVRVNLDSPPATFAVLDGTAHIERRGSPNHPADAVFQTDVRAGETLRGDPNDPSRYFLTQEIAADSWDQWNEDLDQAAAADAANGTPVRSDYAGAQGYGWSDLDANGTWYDVPGEGPVWQPQLAADDSFDPYGDGAWISYPGGGYVWASSYSWGWTPYRCGSWSYYNQFGWGWAPGTACGGTGWGFAGGGRPVNIARAPAGYRTIRIPSPGHGPERPLAPIHTSPESQPERASGFLPSGPRQVAGVTAIPIKPVARSFANPDVTTGSSLRRDYPVDAGTHSPVLGLASTQPAIVRTTPVQHEPSANGSPSYRAQPYSAPTPSPSSTEPQRSYQQSVPAQRSSPPPEHQNYSPPPQQHSSPPPPPPQSHPSPPPPAPAPAETHSPK